MISETSYVLEYQTIDIVQNLSNPKEYSRTLYDKNGRCIEEMRNIYLSNSEIFVENSMTKSDNSQLQSHFPQMTHPLIHQGALQYLTDIIEIAISLNMQVSFCKGQGCNSD
jgi:bifunctional N-acetylglucosamine-1-phosphate-uridyltransferase/glucosamine-1-phosphate-acetyltransferase GlmU-like protein